MKICVTATENTLDAPIDPRFGRAAYFVIVDSETMAFEAVPNMAVGAMSGAGIQAAQTIAGKGVNVLITGNVGPNAFQALSSAGIRIVVGAYGTVREVIEKYKRGELRETGAPTVGGHFGMGMGRGMGRGRKRWP
ncbi:MAG: NifB/NifX family molybdenum-iron cluster-binding protein [Candidatus Bathyarchaeota archaeon]|nr:NifB/NifX family molybdenum-iron cluster-binding protein [Candidatus Bathyarchaeota archaeon]